jgi:hypothetical protein
MKLISCKYNSYVVKQYGKELDLNLCTSLKVLTCQPFLRLLSIHF